MRRITLLPLLIAALLASGAVRAQSGEAPALTVYPSFHVKFDMDGKNYLLASTVLVNISQHTMRSLTLTQTYPEDLVLEPAPEGIHEYFARPEGFTDSIDAQTYTMHTPLLRRGEITSALVVLRYDGRPSSAKVPPARIEYSAGGKNYAEEGPPLTLELKKYSKYSGTLSDFIKRYAGVVLSFPRTEGPDWGFSGFSSRVRGKTPYGLVEVEGDGEEGRFSLIRGAPGDTRVIMVSWRPEAKARPTETAQQALDVARREIVPSSAFSMDVEAAAVSKGRLGRNDAWEVTSRWKDRIVDRLGEGPVKWYIYTDRSRSRQYVFMIAAQGRGAGPENANTPNEAKEAELMKELEQIAASFRPA